MRWKWWAPAYTSDEQEIIDRVGPATAYPDRRGCHGPGEGWNQTTQILPTIPLMTRGQLARANRPDRRHEED